MPNSQLIASPEFEVDNDEVRKLFWGEHGLEGCERTP
jgi:hypothetical protein